MSGGERCRRTWPVSTSRTRIRPPVRSRAMPDTGRFQTSGAEPGIGSADPQKCPRWLRRGCVTARMRYSEDAGERFTWQTAARQASSLSDLQRKRRFRREEPETAVRSLADGVPEVHNPTGSSVVFAALKSKSSVGVGTPGFEPGTSAPPERRANRAAPCPESVSPRSDQPLWKTPCNKRSLCSEVSGSLVCGPLGWRRRASRLRKGL